MPIRAVLLDLFDTLVDLDMNGLPRVELRGRSVPTTAGALHEAVRRQLPDLELSAFAEVLFGVDRELRETHQARGRELPTLDRFTEVCRRLGLDDRALPERLTGVHMQMLRDRATLPPHHPQLLADLAGRVRVGLCSNFSHSPTALGILDDFGLREPLHAIAISDAVGLRKPRAEIFEAVLGELGIEPSEALHVGDNLGADVAGAAGAGIRSAWLTRRVAHPERALREHDGPAPDHRLGDLSELVGLLDELG